MAKARMLVVLIIGALLLTAFIPGSAVAAPPTPPTNFSPADGEMEISPLHTFSYDNVAITPINVQWQLRKPDGSYDKPLWNSGLVSVTEYQFPVGLLDYGQKYYWRVRVQDDTGAWSLWSTETSFQVIGNSPPNQPKNVVPTNEEAGVSRTPTLNASDFTDPDVLGYDALTDTHSASRWQERTGSGTYSSPVLDSHYTGSTIAFVAATKKITDSAKGLAIFKTGETIVVTGSTFNNGKYTVAQGNVAGEVVVAEPLIDESAGDIVSISYETTSLTSFVVPETKLAAGTPYYWHVSYQDSYGNWSAYSSETSFTTKSVSSAPVASFTADKTSVTAGTELVTFTDNSTPAGEIRAWSWNYGDGVTENWTLLNRPPNGQIPHKYTVGGTYTVSLTVSLTEDYAAGTTNEKVMEEPVVVHAKPEASIGVLTSPAKAGEEVAFKDNSSPTGDITSWEWQFDDGTTEQWTATQREAAGGQIKHIFQKAGQHSVSLTVKGELGGKLVESYYNKQINVTGGGGFHFGLWMIGVALAAVVVVAGVMYLVRARKGK